MSYYSSRSSTAPAKKKATSDKNQQIIKTLLKDPGNRYCADCKTSQHPRWASWSLGVFICIRCSGIHRSLGTHVSKVRSIDLDTWSDEQLAPLINWGNTRANKYWESKLPDDYVPDDSKIASFIRTKYDLKRWVASPTIPDPSTLDNSSGGTSSTSHSAVQEKTNTVKKTTATSLIPDLLGDDAPPAAQPTTKTINGSSGVLHDGSQRLDSSSQTSKPAKLQRESTKLQRESTENKTETKSPATGESLLFGVDFSSNSALKTTSSANTSRSSISSTTSSTTSRPDLKKSILSLYSSSNNSAFVQRAPNQQSSAGFDITSATNKLSLNGGLGSNDKKSTNFGLFDSLTASKPSNGQSAIRKDSNEFGSFNSASNVPFNGSSHGNFMASNTNDSSTFNNLNGLTSLNNFSTTSNSSSSTNQSFAQNAIKSDDVHWNFGSSTPSSQSNLTSTSTPIPSEQDIFANVWK